MHKFLHDNIDIDKSLAKSAKGVNNNVVPINAGIQAYANSFAPATIRDWNSLPSTAKNEEK